MNISIVAAFAFSIASAAMLQAAEPDREIKEIEIRNTGAGRIDPTFVELHTAIRTGATLDRPAISRDIRSLLKTERFSEVDAHAEDVPGGVKLVYALRNRLILSGEVEVRGCKFYGPSKIRKLLELREGDPVDDRIVGEKVQKVLEKYRSKSYKDATARWDIRVTDPASGLATVTVILQEGLRSRIRRVIFEGNANVSDKELYATLQPPPWWNVLRWFSRNRFERDNVEMAEPRIRDLYMNRGYLEVAVSPPEIKEDEKGRLTIIYRIREGIPYRFGSVNVTGGKLFPETDLQKQITAQTGSIASQSVIEEGSRRIEDFYGSRGYIDTTARPTLHPDRSKGTVDATYTIREGGLVHIRNIHFRGNTRTRDKVVRRELIVKPGEIFDEVKVRRSERIIQNLGFFDEVRADDLATLNPGERDLVFDLKEKNTGQFHIGAGFSSVDNLIGFSELSQGNFDLFGWPYFTGGGQKLRLRVEYGSSRKEYTLDFVEPWFLDRRLALGFDIGRREWDYDDYEQTRTGAGVSLSKPLPGANRVTIRYRIDRVEITDVADTNRYVYVDPPHDDYYFTREEDRLQSALRLTVTHDTRNRPFIPTCGNYSYVFGELMGGPLGMETDLYNLGLNASQYIPLWFGHVLQMRFRFEVIEEFGGADEVPLSNRLFAGGGRTIRGYDYREVGPKVVPAESSAGSNHYRAVGGRTLGVAKVDYTVPVVTGIRLATFFDVGNVWRDAYDFDLNQTASSAGLGIRLDIPGFPITLDYAWPLKKDNEITDTERWVFWIGYDF